MAPPFLRRTGNLTCFFCLSAVSPAPADARSYRCPHCGCRNRFDANGEILSDEPAMHDEKLNATSFAKRGSSFMQSFTSTAAAHCPPQHPRTRTGSHPRTLKRHSATHVRQTRCSWSTSSQIICHLHRQVPCTNPMRHYIDSDHCFTASRSRSTPRTTPCVS
jgi:hypothetical protein